MKKSVVIMAILAVLSFTPVVADSIDEGKIMLLVSAGSETREVSGSLLLQDDCGRILTPHNGVVEIEEGRLLIGQVVIEGAKSLKDYDVQWTNLALVDKRNLSRADFDQSFGWIFSYQPNPAGTTPLNVVLVKKNGKSDYVRFFFKITYDKDPARSYGQLWVKVIPRKETASYGSAGDCSSESWNKVTANFMAQDEYNHQVAGKLDNLEARIGNIESWCQTAANGSSGASYGSSKMNYRIKVYHSNGKPFQGQYTLCVQDDLGPHEYQMNCPAVEMKDADPGKYQIRILVPGGSSSWVPYTPYNGCTVEMVVSN